MAVKNNIKILRVEKNLSQEELARLVNVTQTAVSQWEIGRTSPDTQMTDKLAVLFDVSVDYLLGRTDERTNLYYAIGNNGHFIQGNGSMTVGVDAKISKEEAEILRVYRMLGVRERNKLMGIVFELEDESKGSGEED